MADRKAIKRTDSQMERRAFLKTGTALGLIPFFSGFEGLTAGVNIVDDARKQKLMPVIASDWWLIGAVPKDLSPPPPEEVQRLVTDRRKLSGKEGKQYDDYGQILAGQLTKIEPVDHHLFQGPDGYWHLWGCVRNTSFGRVLYHWRARKLEETKWEETGEIIRSDANAGECIHGWYGQEWIQSPYIIYEKGKYYMFYGGFSTGKDKAGNTVYGNPPHIGMRKAESQMCLMTSVDGLNWQRHKNDVGFSRVFVGPGTVRDPSLIKIKDLWYMYYTGDEQNHLIGGVFVRTSEDLINWSDYKMVHHDATFGATTWQHECPHVLYRSGYYYLMITENYKDARTHVYRSEDPMDFGFTTEASQRMYVGLIACAAPEVYPANGKEYISSSHNPSLGTQMAMLEWKPV
jgi:hypothetical protein